METQNKSKTKKEAKVKGRNTDVKDLLIKFGKLIGIKAKQNNDIGILIDLKNCTTFHQFLNVLKNISIRLNVSIPDKILELIGVYNLNGNGDPVWDRVKLIICLHAYNVYNSKNNKSE